MIPNKQNKVTKNKLECLNHQGCLQMLVDYTKLLNPYVEVTEQFMIELVSKNTAHLKVMYMNDITPEPVVKQMSIEEVVAEQYDKEVYEKLAAIGTVKKDKNKKK